jgi:hypothetical protein
MTMIHDSIFVKPGAFTTLTCTAFDCDTFGIGSATPQSTQASADQAVVTLGNANSEIGGLTIGSTYSESEVEAFRDKCEELADDVRALSTLVHSLRTALVNCGIIKGAA